MAEKTATRKVNCTKNYSLFGDCHENRPLNAKKHKRLEASMRKYGFLPCFPIVCVRVNNKLVVRDGQHRLFIASKLGLSVYWIEETTDFDIAEINSAAEVWILQDYAKKWADNGRKAYAEGIAFASEFRLPIGRAFALLCGSVSLSNAMSEFKAGTFTIKDRDWARNVAALYAGTVAISPCLKTARFLEACMAACRVKGFDAARFLHGAKKLRELLVDYATRDGFLTMMEQIYNHARRTTMPLKFEATKAMRDRCAVHRNGNGK